MDPYGGDMMVVVPATVLPPGVRYSVLSKELHELNHLAVDHDDQRYLAVHPGYSHLPRGHKLRLATAITLTVAEAFSLLLAFVGLLLPCYLIDGATYTSMDAGYGARGHERSVAVPLMVVCSSLVIALLGIFSCVCPLVFSLCVPRDQHSRLCEEDFNRELLEMRGAQVHADGRVFSADGVPSAWKQEGMQGPCCGFEANELSRLSRNANMFRVQLAIECVSVVLLSVVLHDMTWVYQVAVSDGLSAEYLEGFYITIIALVFRVAECVLYGFLTVRVLWIAPQRRMPNCQLVPLTSAGTRAAELAMQEGLGSYAGEKGGEAKQLTDAPTSEPSRPDAGLNPVW